MHAESSPNDKRNMRYIKLYIKTMEGIIAHNKTRNNNNYVISTEFVTDLNNYLNLNIIGNTSFIVITDSYNSFCRKI